MRNEGIQNRPRGMQKVYKTSPATGSAVRFQPQTPVTAAVIGLDPLGCVFFFRPMGLGDRAAAFITGRARGGPAIG